MKATSINGIILGHKNLGESDKIIHIYSRELGKLRIVAKGARKITSKFTGHLETLNVFMASIYFGPRNIILTEITTERTFKNIRENFERLNSALSIADITNKTVYENQLLCHAETNYFVMLKLTTLSC
ncbi:DNA repair protein RecO [Candidatus Peregrinibacteria bacterium]|nr:DNA repair protein RecO [Candidatus Peregrinibacteria bacterium]